MMIFQLVFLLLATDLALTGRYTHSREQMMEPIVYKYKETHTVKHHFFLKAVNVIQILFASLCKHLIGSFILKFSFRKININLNKTVFKPDVGQFAKSQKRCVCNTALFQRQAKAMRQ